MPDINTGLPLRWENSGTIEVYNVAGSTAYSVLNVEPGSLRFKPGYNQYIEYSDRGTMKTAPLVGDEMPGEISFTARISTAGYTGTTDLNSLLRPADSGGVAQVYKIVVKIPTYRGASTGVSATFEYCNCPEPPEYQAAGSGQELDKYQVKLISRDAAVAIASY